MSALLDDLNPPQAAAVLHGKGPLLILAGAGSGKTRVITRRVAHLVQVKKVFPWKILAVTFTNKAAREMRERIAHLLGPEAQGLTVATFHSASAMILRREAESAGLNRSFLIYDDSDQVSLARRVVKEFQGENDSTPRELLSRIDAEKNQGRLPDDVKPGGDPRQFLFQKMYRAYQNMLRAANAVDFGDLLLLVVSLFMSNEEVRLRYQRRFEHVMVDEFQDTNPVQYQFLKLLAPPPHSNVVVVGDDDQSIYRWRGAEVDNILGFPKTYSVHADAVVKLEQNYRSDQTILAAANEVISKNRRRMDKKLWSARPQGEKLQLLIARDERQEAQLVAEHIHHLRNQGRCDFDGMAVFYRTNAQSRVFEEAFRLGQVPYVLVSGRSFYERAEIKDATSYLRLMVNPKSDADVLRVINTPARGIGDTTVERVSSYAASAGISLYEALLSAERISSLNAGALKRVTQFAGLLKQLVDIGKQNPDATAATQAMYEATKLVDSYLAEGSEEAMTRAENLKELLSATQEFDRQRAERFGLSDTTTGEVFSAVVAPVAAALKKETAPSKPKTNGQTDLFAEPAIEAPEEPVASTDDALDTSFDFGDNVNQSSAIEAFEGGAPLEMSAPPLQSFLEQLSLVGDADGETGQSANRVSLMTVHAAKGLEFDAVFVTGLEEEVFPHRRATTPDATEDDMAEERRLCYVAFTRARRHLWCSFAQTRALFGELRFNPPSRFLSDVSQDLFDVEDDGMRAPVAPAAIHPLIRRRERDEGPTIDKQYDQSIELDAVMENDVAGIRVRHNQFGDGVVMQVNGKGPNAKLLVRFGMVGEKTVIARFLTPL